MTPDIPDDDIWVLADDIAAAHHRRNIITDWHYRARKRLRTAICEALMAERRAWSAIISRDAEYQQTLLAQIAALSQSPDNGEPRHE